MNFESCIDINNCSSDPEGYYHIKLLNSQSFNVVFLLKKVILFQDVKFSLKLSIVPANSYTSPKLNLNYKFHRASKYQSYKYPSSLAGLTLFTLLQALWLSSIKTTLLCLAV